MTTRGGQSVDRDALRSYITGAYRSGGVLGEAGREFSLRPHGVPERHGEALRDLAVREGAVHTVETGFCLGLSALFLCEAITGSGRADARHVAIDPNQGLWDSAGLRTIREAGVSGVVEFHALGSEIALPQLLSGGQTFDLAFIDGDHRFEGAFIDLYYLHQLVKPGGLMVVDDVWMPAVRLAVAYFASNFGLQVEPVALVGNAFACEPWLLRHEIKGPPKARMAVLRRPLKLPQRRWDHFVPFADWETGKAPDLALTVRSVRGRLGPLLRRLRGTSPLLSGGACHEEADRQGAAR